MGSFYRLQIQCEDDKKNQVESILGESNDEPAIGWGLVIEEDSTNFIKALDIFIELIGENLYELREIGISMESVTFWYMYEYEQQCNMEFSPHITKRMGELGVTLCISCWEK